MGKLRRCAARAQPLDLPSEYSDDDDQEHFLEFAPSETASATAELDVGCPSDAAAGTDIQGTISLELDQNGVLGFE